MSQVTVTVDHPGTHAPSSEQLAEALKAAEGGWDGPYVIIGYTEKSGGPSEYTLEEAPPEASAEDAAPVDVPVLTVTPVPKPRKGAETPPPAE